MDKAFDYGVTFFDTADAYPIGGALESMGRTEEYIGNWLKGRREQIVLASKFFLPMGTGPNDRGGSRKHIFQAAHASLRRLQTYYLDLYQMHFPDVETPLDETLRALDDLVHSGKVRYIGCSNYPCAGYLVYPFHKMRRRGRYQILYRSISTSGRWRYSCSRCCILLCFRTDTLSS